MFLPRISRSGLLNHTYVLVPKYFLRGLLGVCGTDLPTGFDGIDSISDDVPVSSNINLSTISYFREFFPIPLTLVVSDPRTTVGFDDDGKNVSPHSAVISDGYNGGDRGLVTVETVLIRLDTKYVPSGRFPVYSNMSIPQYSGAKIGIGYDAAVCVQMYELWITETYKPSITSPSILRVVEKGCSSTSPSPGGSIRGPPLAKPRCLNATGKDIAFEKVDLLGQFQMRVVNRPKSGIDFPYATSPTVGPVVPPRATLLLTPTYSTAHFFHRWCGSWGIYRTLRRPVLQNPRTDRCGELSTIPCGIRTRCRTIIQG